MKLEQALATALLTDEPLEAARALEMQPPEAAARVLSELKRTEAAQVLCRMSAAAGAQALRALGAEDAAACLQTLSSGQAALLLRRLEEGERRPILEALPEAETRALRALLRFPEHTAGALMDPNVLALPADLSIREAMGRVRAAAHHARYNVYVVDREQRLVGVVNLRELLMARPTALISAVMTHPVRSLPARADRQAILEHPGWRLVHALPVVDEGGVYLGALRYRTLRQLEEALLSTRAAADDTARALGELFRAGATGLLEAVAATAPAGRRSSDGA